MMTLRYWASAALGFLGTAGLLGLAGWWKAARDEASNPGDSALKAPRTVDDWHYTADELPYELAPQPAFEPTEDDWTEYAAWCAERDEARAECPRDYGHTCEECDANDALEAAAMAWERDRLEAERSDGWYLDMVARAGDPHNGWRA